MGKKTNRPGFVPRASPPSREKAWAEILAITKRASDPSKPVQTDLFDVRRGDSLCGQNGDDLRRN